MNAHSYLFVAILLGVLALTAGSASYYGVPFANNAGTGSLSTTSKTLTTFGTNTTGLIISSSTTSTTTISSGSHFENGTLDAEFSIGPTQPVCYANSGGTVPSYYSSIEIVITRPLTEITAYQVNWVFDGCNVTSGLMISLAPGNYTLNLSSCPFLGCNKALPRAFQIFPGRLTSMNVSIFTGIV